MGNCSQNRFRERNTPLLFPQCLFQSFVFFTIRQNNSRLSKTCHHMSVTSSQSFVSALLRCAGSDPNAEVFVLGCKNGSLAVHQKYLKERCFKWKNCLRWFQKLCAIHSLEGRDFGSLVRSKLVGTCWDFVVGFFQFYLPFLQQIFCVWFIRCFILFLPPVCC